MDIGKILIFVSNEDTMAVAIVVLYPIKLNQKEKLVVFELTQAMVS